MTLEELKKLCGEATPGPWGCCYDGSSTWSVGPVTDPQSPQIASVYYRHGSKDAQFIAAARTYLPLLIAVAEAASTLLEKCPNLGMECEGYELEHLENALDSLKETK